ncbi:MAG: LysM peptidoglycan-binding domain-containing protein [Thermoleophilia bacterium]|nr:LysM peptidoglycan-binding domain-containing protein [Thermoleophilia bacterium]MDH3725837.1 LysM peptidoglycan-binding domain-containing protein [Thermoleophilia bacterium]
MLLRAAQVVIIAVAVVLMGFASSAVAADVRVAEGDTLSAIAARNGTSVKALAAANGLDDPDLIRVGQRLRLVGNTAAAKASRPATSRYTVTAGDTLGAIAARHGTSVAALVFANGISNPDIVVLGTTLTIPHAAAAPTMAAKPVRAATRRHRITAGENLAQIAARYGTTARALAKANGIADPNLIVTGQWLTVPGRAAGATGLPGARSTTIPVVEQAALVRVAKAEVRRLLNRHSARHGVDANLTRAIAWQESGFQQTVVSHTGAVGVMQLMPETAQWIGRDLLGRPLDPRDVDDNVEGGVAFLKWLSARATSREEAIAGYYQGLRSVRTRGPYDDTQDYVRSVLALAGTV